MMLKDKISFYKVCFDSMQVGIFVCDKKQKIVLANTPLQQIFGYTTNEISEIKANTLFDNVLLFDEFIKNPDKTKFKSPIELLGVIKNGKQIPIELSLGKIEYEGKPYYKALMSDISLRKEKEQEINLLNFKLEEEVKLQNRELEKVIEKLKKSLNKEKELNHLKTKFIALASHEFKTPLSAILTSTELLVKYTDKSNVNKRNEHVLKIKTMINHLNGMLDDLLTLENIESGNITPNFTCFNLTVLVKKIIKSTKPLLQKNQVLEIENKAEDLIYQDSKIIKIILTNLLYNAIKYSGEDGLIHIKIYTGRATIYIDIEDNGIGIPKNDQDFIFKRFFRAKNAIYHHGTGIGLNIVKGYIDSLKGKISFRSIENKGTLFKVQLPKIKCHG